MQKTKTLSLIVLVVLGMSSGLQAQGTIAFNNFTATPGRVYVLTNSGYVLAPGPYHVELMYAPIGSNVFTSARIFSVTNSGGGTGQFFDGSTVMLSGIPAGTGNGDTNSVQLYLRGWTGPYADFFSAYAGSGFAGWTDVFLNPVGGAGTALPANLTGWQANNPLLIPVIPEPSSLSLMGLAGGVVWLFRGKGFRTCRK